jgi:putative MATE family efflux protein
MIIKKMQFYAETNCRFVNIMSQTPSLQVNTNSKQILSISLPIALAILVPQLNFITNNIFLGALSKQALAIGGITGVYYLIFGVMGQGLNNGLQALISRRAGENRIHEIGVLFTQGVLLSIIIAVFGIAFTHLVAPGIFEKLLNDPSRIHIVISFLKIRIWGLPFLFIYQMRNALLVGTNQSKFLIIGTATEAIVNIFFDYSLIFGHFGMPAMGINGAAYASIIAEASGLLVIYLVIHFQKIGSRFGLFDSLQISYEHIKLIVTQSLPLMMQYMISIISWEIFYILIEHRGESALAVSNAMRNIFGFFGSFTWAFAATSNTMVSNIIGQGMQEKVKGLVLKINKWSLAFAIMVCLLLNIFSHAFLSIYGQGEDFIVEATPVFRVVSFALLIMACAAIWLNAVTGTGASKVTLSIEFSAIIVYLIYNYLVLEYFQLPIMYGWGSEIIYWLNLWIPSIWYIQSGRWENKKI